MEPDRVAELFGQAGRWQAVAQPDARRALGDEAVDVPYGHACVFAGAADRLPPDVRLGAITQVALLRLVDARDGRVSESCHSPPS